MPGTFVHLLLAERLLTDLERLDREPALTRGLKAALVRQAPFALLGAVSPDLPYLALLQSDAGGWANAMHYGGTWDFVRRGIAVLRAGAARGRAEEAWERGLAWLLGYVSHVQADVMIHPVVNALVGDYAEHALDHRRCELQQDAWAFYHYRRQSLTRVEWLSYSGLRECTAPGQRDLHPAIVDLWRTMLGGPDDPAVAFPGNARHPQAEPDPAAWYAAYVRVIDDFAEEGGRFPLLVRHWLQRQALVYPEPADVESRFVTQLPLAAGARGSLAGLLADTEEEILAVWTEVAAALTGERPGAFTRANVNLDTGRLAREAEGAEVASLRS